MYQIRSNESYIVTVEFRLNDQFLLVEQNQYNLDLLNQIYLFDAYGAIGLMSFKHQLLRLPSSWSSHEWNRTVCR